jgi:hypothetical protein
MLAAANPYNPYAAQRRYLGNDFELASFCIVSGPRCIWTTPFWKMIIRSFLALHEPRVGGQSS